MPRRGRPRPPHPTALRPALLLRLLLLLLFLAWRRRAPAAAATPQVSDGQLQSGAGLGGGFFATSPVGNLTVAAPDPIPSRAAAEDAAPRAKASTAAVEFVRLSGTYATVVHGGGGSVAVAQGDSFELVGNSPATDGTYVVSAVDSRTQFRFATPASAGTHLGGHVVVSRVASAAVRQTRDQALTDHLPAFAGADPGVQCPAGYYCTTSPTAEVRECGGPHVFCPPGSSRPQPVFAGEPTGGSPNAPFAFYSTGGSGSSTRTDQRICPVGSFCVGGEKFDCPAGRYGEREGENKPNCTGLCGEFMPGVAAAAVVIVVYFAF